MDERDGKLQGGELEVKSPAMLWLENYWYHYKWHTLAAIFIIIVVVVCTLQMCSREEIDVQIMYAGNDDISQLRGDAELSEHEELIKAICRFVGDRDGDGKRTAGVLNLFIPSDEHIAELLEQLGDEYEINEPLVRSNLESFNSNIVYGDYYICIIGDHLLEMKQAEDEKDNPFVKITEYLPEGAEYVFGDESTESDGYVLASEYGVYLHSTPLADNPAFSELDRNTVIVMRRFSEVTSAFASSRSEAYFRFSEDTLRKMLADEAYE